MPGLFALSAARGTRAPSAETTTCNCTGIPEPVRITREMPNIPVNATHLDYVTTWNNSIIQY
jgi:hypothetical protein